MHGEMHPVCIIGVFPLKERILGSQWRGCIENPSIIIALKKYINCMPACASEGAQLRVSINYQHAA